MKKILVFMADGCEEVEALTSVDILRRAGFSVDMASVSNEKIIHGAHGINIESDININDVTPESYDGVLLPGGGPGYKNLAASSRVKEITLQAAKDGKLVSAICAAPTVLGGFGLLKGKTACCYPGMEDGLTGAKVSQDKVCVDGNFITSRGVGTAIDFALRIVEYFTDKKTADQLGVAIVHGI